MATAKATVSGSADQDEHESGLLFSAPNVKQFDGLKGKTCFGQLLNAPEFRTLEEFGARIDGLDHVVRRPIMVADGAGVYKENPDFLAVVGSSGETYAVVSPKYKEVQDRDVALPLFDAAQARGLTTVGRVAGVGTGRTTGHVLLANPEFRVQLLESYKDDVMLGIRWHNSYNTDTSFGGEVFGVRTVCINYNLWGARLMSLTHKHGGEIGKMLDTYEALVNAALDASPVLCKINEKALAVEIVKGDAADLLWGAGFGVMAVAEVAGNLARWCPEVKKLGANLYTLYQGVTAYATHGKMYRQRQIEVDGKQAARLLDAKYDELLKKGAERRQKWEEAEKAKTAQERAAELLADANEKRKAAVKAVA